MNNIILSVVCFMLGTIFGYVLRGITNKMDNSKEASLIIIVVTFIWATSVIIDMLSVDYETPLLLHGIMGGIVGYFFKFKVEGKNVQI